MDRTARIIVWLILDRSVGWGQPWADLDAEQFASVARVKVASAAKILGELLRDEIVRSHSVKGRLMYAVNRPPDPSGPKVEGKCRTCGQTGTIDLDPKWRPIPHDFFWKVPQVCDAAMLFCMGIIAEATMRWDDARRWPIVVPARISLQTFMAGGYGRSTIIEALNRLQAKKLGFIGSDRRDEEAKPTFKGKPGLYWLIPENFENGEKRTFRKLDRSGGRRTLEVEIEPEPEAGTDDEPEPTPASGVVPRQAVQLNGETGAKPDGVEMAEVDEPKEPTRPIEFVSAPVGLCRKCRAYGPVDLVAEDSGDVEGNTPRDSLPPPADDTRSHGRAGPSAASKPTEKADKWVAAPELRDLYAFLLEIPAPELPDEAVTREISAALHGAPLETLHQRCKSRAESIRRAEHPFKYICAIARGIGDKYRTAEKERHAAALRRQEQEAAQASTPLDLSLDEAREFLSREDCCGELRAEILSLYPELAQ